MFESRVLRAPDRQLAVSQFMNRTYGWMFFGLMVTAGVSYVTASSETATRILFENPALLYVLLFAELGVVMGLSFASQKISSATAMAGFVLYAALNGVTFSLLLRAYTMASIGQVFMITAGMFGGLALFGTVTRKDLTGMGAFFGMGLWGMILVGVVNIFIRSDALSMGMSAIGVLVFSGLTAYDSQKIKAIAYSAADQGADRDGIKKQAIFGALTLYLDFINLFLSLLRLLGNRSRD